MKKIVKVFGIVLAAVFVMGGFLWLKPASLFPGDSERYTLLEREEICQMVADKVRSWEGCHLYSVAYAGDEICRDELEYCQSLMENCAECMVFQVRFRSPILNAGAFNPNQIYDWTFYLGRKMDGDWVFITWGEA